MITRIIDVDEDKTRTKIKTLNGVIQRISDGAPLNNADTVMIIQSYVNDLTHLLA